MNFSNPIEKSPKISIITACYNAESTIEDCIRSMLHQTYTNHEHIIIDGNSSDNTRIILKKYKRSLITLSEPDSGISDAMNKGIKMASGDYLLFIHADDQLLESNTLQLIANDLINKNFPEILSYNILYGNAENSKELKPKGFIPWINIKNTIPHQGCICSCSVFDQIGFFDTNLKIAMDYDFFLRAYHSGIKCNYIDRTISKMGDDGISSKKSWENLSKRLLEEKTIHKKNNSLPKIVFYFWWLLYPKFKKIKHF